MYRSYGMDYMMHATALMVGESTFGRRVYDIIRTLDLLSRGAKSVHLRPWPRRAAGGLVAMLRDGSLTSRSITPPPASSSGSKPACRTGRRQARPKRAALFRSADLYAALANG